jgi:ElaB/YqjD/DUF883 family membrane-anchored ribosome-binding protein
MNAAVVELFDGVDDLIRRVAHTENPEIRRVRAKVHAALVAAKNGCDHTAEAAPFPPAYAVELEQPVVDSDARTLGVALLVGLGLCLMLTSRQ